MAIDFSQVKTITIPEGSVKKITDSNGTVLWKAGPQWRTVWEGNQKIGYGGWTGNEYLFATEPYSNALKIRVSFSDLYCWRTSGDDGSYTYTPSNQNSPVTYDNIHSISSKLITLVKADAYNSTRTTWYESTLYYSKTSGKIYGNVSKNKETDARSYIVITKIEVCS